MTPPALTLPVPVATAPSRASVALVILSAGVFAGCSDGPASDLAGNPSCTVRQVNDGDTLTCENRVRVRLLLIDAPELDQAPWGHQSRDALAELAPVGSRLDMEYDIERVDPFGRELAYLYDPEGTLINEAMIARGYAVVLVIPPNGRLRARMEAAMEKARAGGLGLWGTWGFTCVPRDFRAGRCP